MQFTSATYLVVFLPATVLIYWLAPRRLRLMVLLTASYAFYLSWSPAYGGLLAASTVINYAIGRRLADSADPKRLLAAGVIFNLGLLAFFKYSGLLTEAAAGLAQALSLSGDFEPLRVVLPLAISFFTFEMISMLVDVYRGDTRLASFWTFATYKAFFPKLLSGPITRHSELAPQLSHPRRLEFTAFQLGLYLVARGLFKKLAVANNLALLADPVFANPRGADSSLAAVAILAFGLQIYFDFSSYTDIARGSARMLGLELPQNFRAPYAATSFRDFWRRWHLSLSRWLRDYLYIPLGGSLAGRSRTYRNLMITMVLGGLWHGAGWQFAVWGAFHGLALSADHALPERWRWQRGRLGPAAGWMITISAVFFLWVPFRAGSLSEAFEVLKALGHAPTQLSAPTLLYPGLTVQRALVLLVVAVLLQPAVPRISSWFRARAQLSSRSVGVTIGFATVAWWLLAILSAPAVNPPFIYFRF